MRNLGQDALWLAGLGWQVFPLHSPDGDRCDCRRAGCPSPSKHPRTRNGLLDATTDAARIAGWWEMWPQANIGVRTGQASGLVVVDVDPRHGGDETLRRLIEEHGQFPVLPCARTGGGGWHFYFAHPGGTVRNSEGAVGPGVDVRGDGGYVVVPPSVHQTGVGYTWEPDYEPGPGCLPPAPPAWLLTLMQPRTRQSDFAQEGQEAADVPPGKRNSTLTSIGGGLRRRGLAERQIYAALLAINAEWTQPLDQTEIARIAASVSRYEPEVTVELVGPRPARTDGGQVARRPGAYLPEPFTARELQHLVLPDVRWAVPDLLPEGLALLAGRPKLGKSWWSLGLALTVATGGIAFGRFPCDDGDALVLALEDTKSRLKGRMATIADAGSRWPERLYLETRWPRQDEGGLEALDSWLGQHPHTRLVVVDTLVKFRARAVPGGKRGDVYGEDYAIGEGLQELAGRHGVAIVVITHYNKSFQDDWLNSITGSTGLTAVADTILGLERPRGAQGQGEAILHITGRDIGEADYGMAFGLGLWQITGDAAEAQTTRETRDLVQAMAAAGRPVNKADVAAALGLSASTAYMRLYRASADGAIASLGGGFFCLRTDDGMPASDLRFAHSPSRARARVGASKPVQVSNHSNTSLTGHTAPTGLTGLTGLTAVDDLDSTPLLGRVSDNGKSDEPDATSSLRPVSRVLQPVLQTPEMPVGEGLPAGACEACGQVAWVRTVSGVLCSVCRPTERPAGGSHDA